MEPRIEQKSRFQIEKLEERIAPTLQAIGGPSGEVTGCVTTATGVGGYLTGAAAEPSGVAGHVIFGSGDGPQPGQQPC